MQLSIYWDDTNWNKRTLVLCMHRKKMWSTGLTIYVCGRNSRTKQSNIKAYNMSRCNYDYVNTIVKSYGFNVQRDCLSAYFSTLTIRKVAILWFKSILCEVIATKLVSGCRCGLCIADLTHWCNHQWDEAPTAQYVYNTDRKTSTELLYEVNWGQFFCWKVVYLEAWGFQPAACHFYQMWLGSVN